MTDANSLPTVEKDAGVAMSLSKGHSAEKGVPQPRIVWTCCDPNGATFCVGCGEDIKRGRTLPHRVTSPGSGDANE